MKKIEKEFGQIIQRIHQVNGHVASKETVSMDNGIEIKEEHPAELSDAVSVIKTEIL